MAESVAAQEFRAREKVALNFLVVQFVQNLRKINLTEKKISAIIKFGLLFKVADALFHMHALGSDLKNLQEVDVEKGCGGDVKWMLIRAYYRDYSGLRFPRIYAERYCSVETGYKASAIQEKFKILEQLLFIEMMPSKHIDCEDICISDELVKIMDDFYNLKINAYTEGSAES